MSREPAFEPNPVPCEKCEGEGCKACNGTGQVPEQEPENEFEIEEYIDHE